MTGRAWNSTPEFSKGPKNRLTNSGRAPNRGVRCTYVSGGQACDAFPSWEVPGTDGRERRCQKHKGES